MQTNWDNTNLTTTDLITIEELQEALKQLKNRKASGIDKINSELLKYGGMLLQWRLLHIINTCWQKLKIPNTWKVAEVISIFKKGDKKNCENYRGISLLCTMYKVYARIVNARIKAISEALLGEEQNGFRKGRSTSDNVFILQQILEKRREFNLPTHLAFIDFEKAFDNVNRTKLWDIMEKQGYPAHIVNVMKTMYEGSKIIINTGRKKTEEIPINKGVRQGCPISPTLFNIYINDIIQKWKLIIKKGICITENDYLNILLYADDAVILQEGEDDLQRSVHHLNKICKGYDIKISKEKTKVMAFCGKSPVRTKIVVDNKIIEQVSSFNYLGCEIGHDEDTNKKLSKFQSVCGIIHRTMKNKTRKETRIKFYNTMAIPVLLYGSESWVPKKSTYTQLQSAEMKFLRRTKGCTREDRFKNDEIREELNVKSLNERMMEYRNKWLQHVQRMDNSRLPKLAFQYKPRGTRDIGRPKKRWREVL